MVLDREKEKVEQEKLEREKAELRNEKNKLENKKNKFEKMYLESPSGSAEKTQILQLINNVDQQIKDVNEQIKMLMGQHARTGIIDIDGQ